MNEEGYGRALVGLLEGVRLLGMMEMDALTLTASAAEAAHQAGVLARAFRVLADATATPLMRSALRQGEVWCRRLAEQYQVAITLAATEGCDGR